jgi:pyrimidine operon attenuation protein/uracil phosphoribosyltransferase
MSKAKASATPLLREKIRLMSASEIERTLIRLAHQIIEKNNGVQNLGLVGIKRRGVPLAERLGALISGIEKSPSIPEFWTLISTATTFRPAISGRSWFQEPSASTSPDGTLF